MKIESSLLYAVLAKTFAEIVLLCAVVSVATYANFHPLVRGAIDVAEAGQVAGWACDPAEPLAPVEVQLFIDGRFQASQLADQPRSDLVQAGATINPTHGFNFPLPPSSWERGRHSVQVFVLRKALADNRVLIPLSPEEKSFWSDR